MFSDACGGQNRNYLLMMFLSLTSFTWQVEIQHIFPVRKHSYCQCDRNFGTYANKRKRAERIETEEEYIEIIKSAKNNPFIIVKSSEIVVKNFEKVLQDHVALPKEDIRKCKAVKIDFHPNGNVIVY